MSWNLHQSAEGCESSKTSEVDNPGAQAEHFVYFILNVNYICFLAKFPPMISIAQFANTRMGLLGIPIAISKLHTFFLYK